MEPWRQRHFTKEKVLISSHKRAAGITSTATGTQTTKGHHYLGIATLLKAQRLHLTGPPVVPAEQGSKSRRGRVCATGGKKRRGGEGKGGEGREIMQPLGISIEKADSTSHQ